MTKHHDEEEAMPVTLHSHDMSAANKNLIRMNLWTEIIRVGVNRAEGMDVSIEKATTAVKAFDALFVTTTTKAVVAGSDKPVATPTHK